jgi:hypothetical protein
MSATTFGAGLALDPTGRYALAAASDPARVVVASIRSGEGRELPGFEGASWINSLAFSADGRLAAAAGIRPPLVRIWDLDSGAHGWVMGNASGEGVGRPSMN